jgi:hemoglobin-like flavoprotein
MTSHQTRLVRESFARVQLKADIVALLFYRRLFELKPPLRALFHTDIEQQAARLMQALRYIVDALDQPALLRPALESLGRRHVGYGVKEADYETVGAALLWALGEFLGRTFTAETRAAWAEAYTLVADVMKEASRRSPSAGPEVSALPPSDSPEWARPSGSIEARTRFNLAGC